MVSEGQRLWVGVRSGEFVCERVLCRRGLGWVVTLIRGLEAWSEESSGGPWTRAGDDGGGVTIVLFEPGLRTMAGSGTGTGGG